MLKPLSQESLEKKYAELGLPKQKTDLLHTYFRCFANLYGVISLRDGWEVFKHYEGISDVHKKDFIAFSDIVQREAGHPYNLYHVNDIFKAEPDEPLERLIVNRRLLNEEHRHLVSIYAVMEKQLGNTPYFPEKKVFLSFAEDRFYLTAEGKNMRFFIENLRSDGIRRNQDEKPDGILTDNAGVSLKGKRLADIVSYSPTEQSRIASEKQEAQKQQLQKDYPIPASEKVLDLIRLYMMTGGADADESPLENAESCAEYLLKEYGVDLSDQQFMRFHELYMKLNNSSPLWQHYGWSPNELLQYSCPSYPSSFSIDSNIKKALAAGEMDKEEFLRQLKKLGITLTNE